MREDAWPVAGSLAALAALIAISWRATPDQTDTAVILYLIGGALEGTGVATIGLDLFARRRRARRYQAEASVINVSARMTRERRSFAAATVTGGHDPTVEERLQAIAEHQAREPERIREAIRPAAEEAEQAMRFATRAIDTDARRREAQIVRLIGPSDSASAAWIGFAALLLGVIIGTIANVLSATA